MGVPMQRRFGSRTMLSWAAVMLAILSTVALELPTPPAGAAPGTLPSSFTLVGLGADQYVGESQQRMFTAHPGSPVDCNDGIDNKSASSGVDDGTKDYPASSACTSAADDSEYITTTAGTTTNIGGSYMFPPTSNVPRDLATLTGTNTAGTVNIPVSGIHIPTAFTRQSSNVSALGQNATTISDNAVRMIPIGANVAPPFGNYGGGTAPVSGCSAGSSSAWTGTSAGTGQVTVTGCVYIDVAVYVAGCTGSSLICNNALGNMVPCRSDSFTVSFTTETAGPQSGTRYDAGMQNMKLVSTSGVGGAGNIPALKPQGSKSVFIAGDIIATGCSTANTQFGLGGTRTQTDKVSFTMSADSTSVAMGGSNSCLVAGTGGQAGGTIPQPTKCWAPVAGTINGAYSKLTNPVHVPEGSVVTADWTSPYDPAYRTLSVGSYGGISSSPPAVKSPSGTSRQFVAGNGAVGGTSVTVNVPVSAQFQKLVNGPTLTTIPAPFGPQTTAGIPLVIDNVAPTANAGPNQRIVGTSVTLKGSSADPSDADCPTKRVYTWSRISGPNTPTITPGSGATCRNATATGLIAGIYVFQVSVNDGDGGIGTATTSVEVVATAAPANTLGGRVTNSATGSAISGATVSVYTNPAGAPVTTATTNGTGDWTWGAAAPATNYYVKFSNGGMVDSWYRGALTSGSALPVTAPNILVDGQLGVARTISGTVTAGVGGANVTDTVRLFDENGWVASATSTGGAYSFTNVPAKNTYRVQVAKGSATYVPAWYGTAAIGGATIDGGQASKIDVTAANFTTSNVTVYTPAQSGLAGTTIAAIPGSGSCTSSACQGVQVRIYRTTANGGAWVASATSDSSGNWTVPSLRPGTYRLWFWTKSSPSVPAQTSARPSQWYNGLPGEQYDNTGSIADPYSAPGATNMGSVAL